MNGRHWLHVAQRMRPEFNLVVNSYRQNFDACVVRTTTIGQAFVSLPAIDLEAIFKPPFSIHDDQVFGSDLN